MFNFLKKLKNIFGESDIKAEPTEIIVHNLLQETYTLSEKENISYQDAFEKITKKKWGKQWHIIATGLGISSPTVLFKMIERKLAK